MVGEMSITSNKKGCYEKFCTFRQLKNKANFIILSSMCCVLRKQSMKKQSHFHSLYCSRENEKREKLFAKTAKNLEKGKICSNKHALFKLYFSLLSAMLPSSIMQKMPVIVSE